MLIIKQQCVFSLFRDTHPVIRPVNRGKVYNKQKVSAPCFIPADKAENTAVAVIGIYPLEAVPVIVKAVKGRVFFIQMQQIFYIGL